MPQLTSWGALHCILSNINVSWKWSELRGNITWQTGLWLNATFQWKFLLFLVFRWKFVSRFINARLNEAKISLACTVFSILNSEVPVLLRSFIIEKQWISFGAHKPWSFYQSGHEAKFYRISRGNWKNLRYRFGPLKHIKKHCARNYWSSTKHLK